MLYSSRQTIYDNIVRLLVQSELTVSKLHQQVSKERPVSIQSVYDAVRILVAGGVILKQKGIYSVSAEWRANVVSQLQIKSTLPVLNPDEHSQYVFHSFAQLDIYWKHLNALFTSLYPLQPIFFFTSHEMWRYVPGRKESQETFIKNLAEQKRTAYMLIGADTQFDYLYKKQFWNYRKIQLDPKAKLKRNEHLTICGDFVVITKLPKSTSEAIDQAYNQARDEYELKQKLELIFTKKQRLSVTLHNNQKKAKKLRKRITKACMFPASNESNGTCFRTNISQRLNLGD